MNSVNKTLYIPLAGKAYVSRRGLFLRDGWAEKISSSEQLPLGKGSRSKWLAFYMGIRAAVFDEWVRKKIEESFAEDTVIIHIGCGLDSRAFRVGDGHPLWFDVDFPEVIFERRRYFDESENYLMLEGDLRDSDGWLQSVPERKRAIVIMEGVSMYLPQDALRSALGTISRRFSSISLLLDCYSSFAAKMSRYKNPINEVGVSRVFGIDDPKVLETEGLTLLEKREMTPKKYIDELCGIERFIFKNLYAGGLSKKLYSLYEYEKL